jgi:tRNA1(Val) A37 N6-methylase TrmN6
MIDDITEDTLLDGRVTLRQPAEGYRAAIDPVLLAAATPAVDGEHVLDVGSGVGAASLCLAYRVKGCRLYGVEVQRDLVRLAVDNAVLNGFKGRMDMMVGDLTRPPPRLAAGSFHHVMSNPPFIEAERARPSPHGMKAIATVETSADLATWIDFCIKMVRYKGTITLIHRADRLDELLAALRGRAGGLVLYPLWPTADGGRPAKRVIVQAIKGGAAPLRLSPGLALHANGGYTAEADAILRDGAGLTL